MGGILLKALSLYCDQQPTEIQIQPQRVLPLPHGGLGWIPVGPLLPTVEG